MKKIILYYFFILVFISCKYKSGIELSEIKESLGLMECTNFKIAHESISTNGSDYEVTIYLESKGCPITSFKSTLNGEWKLENEVWNFYPSDEYFKSNKFFDATFIPKFGTIIVRYYNN